MILNRNPLAGYNNFVSESSEFSNLAWRILWKTEIRTRIRTRTIKTTIRTKTTRITITIRTKIKTKTKTKISINPQKPSRYGMAFRFTYS